MFKIQFLLIDIHPTKIMQTDASKYLQTQSRRHRKLKLLFSKLGVYLSTFLGFPGRASGKESACQCRRHKRHRFDLWVRKIPWRRKWQPISVFLPGKSHGQRSLMGYSPLGCKESDTVEHAPVSTFIQLQRAGQEDWRWRWNSVNVQSLLRSLLAGQESVSCLINTINSSSFSYWKLISNMRN